MGIQVLIRCFNYGKPFPQAVFLWECAIFCGNVFAFIPTSIPASKNSFSLKINMHSHKHSHRFLYVNLFVSLFFNVITKLHSHIPTSFVKPPLRARERLAKSNATFMNASRFRAKKDRRSGQRGRAVCSVFRVRVALLRVVVVFRRLWWAGTAHHVEAAMSPAFALDVSPVAGL